MSLRARHLILGAVALALFAAAIALTGSFLEGSFQGGAPVRAVFSAPGVGQQLPEGGDVKVRGVLVGYIGGITYEGGNAVLELRLDRDVDIPADATAEIRSKTVFGQKWVELIPPVGSTASESLISSGLIPDERTIEPLELERSLQLGHDLLSAIPLQDLATVFSELATGFEGREADAATAIDDGLIALRSVNSRSDELDASLRQLREFSGWLDANSSSLLSFMSSLDSANRALVGAAPEFRSNLQSVPTFFDDLAAFQEATESSLGRLVSDGATLAEIVAARKDDLEALIVNLEAFTTVWNSGLEQPCAGLFEADLTCWQVYQLPGLESRGLYGSGRAPDRDEPGDPNFGARRGAAELLTRLLDALRASTGPGDLARAILQPLAGSTFGQEG